MMKSPAKTSWRSESDGRSSCPSLGWALCTVARSGSSWLSQLIGSTGLMGYPAEYLLDWRRGSSELGLSASTSLEEYLGCLMRHRSTPNGVFAIKGSVEELQPFFEFFPSAPCVWLWRENKVEQAVSWHRAHDGGLWTRTEASGPPRCFQFSLERALWFYDEILRREALWRKFFLECNLPPLVLTYENVCQDPLAAVQTIAEHIGVDPSGIRHVVSPLRIVRDETTMQFIEQTAEAVRARMQGSN